MGYNVKKILQSSEQPNSVNKWKISMILITIDVKIFYLFRYHI